MAFSPIAASKHISTIESIEESGNRNVTNDGTISAYDRDANEELYNARY